MPAEMNFQSLQNQLTAYMEKGSALDPVVNINLPYIINQAERKIARELKILGFKQLVQSQFTPGVWTVQKPDRWRATLSWNYGTDLVDWNDCNILTTNSAGQHNALWTPLFMRSLDYLRAYNRDVTKGCYPKFYCDYSYSTWAVAPTPQAAYPFEVIYYEQHPLLDSTKTQNWLTAYIPNLLLYACLLEMAPFIKTDPRIPTWQAMYDRELAAVNSEDLQKVLDMQQTRTQA